MVYTGKTATQFTGCQRGAFGTAAAGHSNGVAVKANMVAGFITALQSAVLAIENEVGTTAARNYVRKDGAVTITGLKTLQDGAEFGSGAKASTGLVRLPNAGAIKWRKQDDSGDLGMALNASNHLAMDAIIDFAGGQTFGAFSYPDATTAAKGIVQIDAVGGLAVAGGVVSLADTAVTPGTYTKTTVDQKGRVTAGATLLAGDLPSHTHAASDITSGSMPFTIKKAGATIGTRRALNLIEGANIGLTVADDAGNDRVNVTVALASVSAHNHAATEITSGTLALARGGTGADLSGTGPGFLKQAGVGAAVTVATITSGELPSHTHTSAQISDATANATASTVVLRDGSGGATFAYTAANNLWAYLDSHFQSFECGAFQTVGGPFENMAKYAEDFTVSTWDKNGGSCSVTANAVAAPDGNSTADTITAVTATPVIQQQIAGLVSGGQYTFYVWAKVASGTKQMSIAIVDNAYAGYLAGPTSITLTTVWQRFKITGTLAGGQTGLWIVVRQFASNGDNWTSGAIYLWGACLQQGNDPKKRLRPYVGVADRLRLSRSRVRRDRDRGQGQRGIAASDLRSRIEPGRPQAARGHRHRRTHHRGRHRQRLPPRRTDGRHESLRLVWRAESENACRSHGGLHPVVFEPVVPERTNPMKLTLDHTQRLNLHALLGAQRADVGSIRAIWALQDKLALDADEEQAVQLKREMCAGQERTVWNPSLSIPNKDFELTDVEVSRIKAAIETWDAYSAAADRRWLEPLLTSISEKPQPKPPSA